MCNKLLNDYKEIPESGYGWKIFHKDGGPVYVDGGLPMSGSKYKHKTKSGFIPWRKDVIQYKNFVGGAIKTDGDGFCFFLTRKEARQSLKALLSTRSDHLVVKKIEYKKGVGKNELVVGMTFCPDYYTPITIALCKQFRITKEAS